MVQGKTFDGSAAHEFEWVPVMHPDVEQDDEVGRMGTAINPNDSGPGGDLPFTHPSGPTSSSRSFLTKPTSAF